MYKYKLLILKFAQIVKSFLVLMDIDIIDISLIRVIILKTLILFRCY